VRLWCAECAAGLQTPTATFCSAACELVNARRRDNARQARERRARAEHRARMKGRERRLLGHRPE